MREIEEIWIINHAGLVIFNTHADQKMEPQLFAGFLNAINNFGKNLTKDNMNSLKIGNELIVLYMPSETNFIVVGRTKEDVSEKKVRTMLKVIYDKFENRFGKKFLSSFDGGDYDRFDAFEEDVEEFFIEKTNKTVGMW